MQKRRYVADSGALSSALRACSALMNGGSGLSVCSTIQLPLASHSAEKGYIASVPDSLGRCGRPGDRDVCTG